MARSGVEEARWGLPLGLIDKTRVGRDCEVFLVVEQLGGQGEQTWQDMQVCRRGDGGGAGEQTVRHVHAGGLTILFVLLPSR